jgi:hypothetical protein
LFRWQREVKLSKVIDGTRVVGKCLRDFFLQLALSQVVYGDGWRNIKKICAQGIHYTERIVALPFVNKTFPESYDFAAMCDRPAEDAYSSAAPDPTLAFAVGLCCPTFGFLFAFCIMMTFHTLLTSLFCILSMCCIKFHIWPITFVNTCE